jgi:hypothetical protein
VVDLVLAHARLRDRALDGARAELHRGDVLELAETRRADVLGHRRARAAQDHDLVCHRRHLLTS